MGPTMALLKFIGWTSTCVMLGVWVGSFEFGGRTPMQHMQRAWKSSAPKLEKVKDHAEDLVDEVKKKVSTKDAARPTEHHTSEDRDAIEKLIAKRAK